MNNQLIAKIIKTNDTKSCPELLYENSLIDKNVAGALARSFVKILCVSKQDSNLNTNLRHSVLSNIRQLCRIEPENHLEVDENFTKNLTEVFVDKLRDTPANDSISYLNRCLDDYLARKMKDVDITSKYQRSLHPEVIQSLLNLNENHHYAEVLAKNILYLDVSDMKNLALVKSLWTNINLANSTDNTQICDISIKNKSEIELLLLNLCYSLLTEPDLQLDELFTGNETLKDLVNKCSVSPECFQICYSILNHIFIYTNYDTDIQNFIGKFIENIKGLCKGSVSILYAIHLSCTVDVLDINLDCLQGVLKEKYVQRTLTQLQIIHDNSETDLIMVLSHFSQWFNVYFS